MKSLPPIEFQPSPTLDDALARASSETGIDHEYWDIFGHRRQVSPDVQCRLLAALGWNTSSHAAIDEERALRFTRAAGTSIPATLVLSQTDGSIPLNLPASAAHQSLRFEITTEDGDLLSQTPDVSQLHLTQQLRAPGGGDRHWLTYHLPLPPNLPLGYHKLKLFAHDKLIAETNLIICPDRAYIPDTLTNGGRAAGLNVTLYGLRSRRNWGCGDFTDLHSLIDWAHGEIGFSFIGVNPLHALHNRVPYNTSPYLPLSVFYKNFIYIDVETVPEFAACPAAGPFLNSPAMQERIAKLRDSEFVEYHLVAQLKKKFLKLLYRQFRRNEAQKPARAAAYRDYCQREGDLLHKFALYCALDEVLHKQDRTRWTWQHWPAEYQSPDTEATRKFAQEHARTIGFYKYMQFVLDEQLSAAQAYAIERGMPIGLYHDLAVATDSCGSDLWAHRQFFVTGCRVGAPPDDFSPDGQDWAFPPPNSAAHLENGYFLYRESIRKIIRLGGALRIDHVMRLFRLFWIPDGASAAAGTYVRDRAADLLRILALESVRAKAMVIGEDLGTVTDEIRDLLSRFRILSYRLFYFERYPDGWFKRCHEYPRQALVSSTTHDLATLTGFWTYSDIEARKAAGLADEANYWRQIDERKRDKQRILDLLHAETLLPHHYARNAEHVPAIDGDLHNAVIGFLACVPSMLLLLNQEDLTLEPKQQNLPGSTAEHPNWQRKMKAAIEDLTSPEYAPYAAMFRDQLARTGRHHQVFQVEALNRDEHSSVAPI